MAFLSDLLIRLRVQTADFQQDLGKAARMAEKSMRDIERFATSAQSALAGLGAAVSVGAFTALIKHSIDAQEEMEKLTQKTGFTAEAITGLKYAADLSDLPMDKLATGVKKLYSNLVAAAGGSKEAAETFRALGVDASIGLKDPMELLLRLADRFQRMPDGAIKSADAVRAFGKAGEMLIPFLNMGRAGIKALTDEAERFGLVLSKEALEAAVEFNDNMRRFHAINEGIIRQFTSSLLPLLIDLQTAMLESSKKTDSLKSKMKDLAGTKNEVEGWAIAVLRGFAFIADAADGFVTVVIASGQALGLFAGWAESVVRIVSMASSPIQLLLNREGIAREFKSAKDALQAGFQDIQATLMAGGSKYRNMLDDFIANRGKLPKQPKGARGGQEGVVPQHFDDSEMRLYTNALQRLEEQLGKLNGMTQEEKTLYEVLEGSLKKLTPAHKVHLLNVALEVDRRKALIETIESQYAAMKELAEQYAASEAAAQEFHAQQTVGLRELQFQTSLLGLASLEQQKLTKFREIDLAAQKLADQALARGDTARFEMIMRMADTLKTNFGRALDESYQKQRDWATGTKQAFQQYIEYASDAAQQAKEFFGSAFRKMEDMLVEFVSTGKLNFRDFAQSVINDLIRIQVRQSLVAPMTAALNSGIGNAIGSIFSKPASNTDSLGSGLQMRAAGGAIWAGQTSIVGERGPELITAAASGQVIPNHQLGGGGGPVFNVDMRGASVEAVMELRRLVQQVNGTIEQRALTAVAREVRSSTGFRQALGIS